MIVSITEIPDELECLGEPQLADFMRKKLKDLHKRFLKMQNCHNCRFGFNHYEEWDCRKSHEDGCGITNLDNWELKP